LLNSENLIDNDSEIYFAD